MRIKEVCELFYFINISCAMAVRTGTSVRQMQAELQYSDYEFVCAYVASCNQSKIVLSYNTFVWRNLRPYTTIIKSNVIRGRNEFINACLVYDLLQVYCMLSTNTFSIQQTLSHPIAHKQNVHLMNVMLLVCLCISISIATDCSSVFTICACLFTMLCMGVLNCDYFFNDNSNIPFKPEKSKTR